MNRRAFLKRSLMGVGLALWHARFALASPMHGVSQHAMTDTVYHAMAEDGLTLESFRAGLQALPQYQDIPIIPPSVIDWAAMCQAHAELPFLQAELVFGDGIPGRTIGPGVFTIRPAKLVSETGSWQMARYRITPMED